MENNPNWIIRPAQQSDYRAARLLLPDAIHFGSGCIAWVAETRDDHRMIAAATLSPRLRSDPLPGARVAVHVIPPQRRQGIARALIEQAAIVAGKFQAQAIFAFQSVEAGSDPEKIWRSLGFTQTCAMQVGVVEMKRAEEYLQPLYEQLAERNWIPQEAKIIPLRKADHAQIATLHAKYLGGTAMHVMWKLSGQSLDPFDMELSPVLIFNGAVKAFTLVRMVGQTCHVDATVVDPTLRGGWANLWLKYEGIRQARAAGAKTMVFQTYDRHTDTRKLNRQMGGVTKHLLEPYRLINGGAPVSAQSSQAVPNVGDDSPAADRAKD